MNQYFLMHKNDVCGTLVIDEDSGALKAYKDYGTGLSPFLGNADVRRMKHWWEGRAVPASRKIMQEVLKQAGCINTKEYLAKNLALSMTDAYWICPIDMNLKYEDVKLSGLISFNDKKIPYHNHTSYDPNASLGGQMEKYWDLNNNIPILVKESHMYYRQQAINEGFATYLHDKQNTNIPFVRYKVGYTEDNGLFCCCDAFTNDTIELVSAYEIIEGSKTRNDLSLYDNYINICATLGIDSSLIRSFMDYQTLTDFAISNTDEHLLNFGVLRNADTMEYIGPAPIFDSGNSMFYTDSLTKHTRLSLLERKITSFYDTEEKMLKNIRIKSIVDVNKLPSIEDVIRFYISYGFPEDRATIIANNYALKCRMISEFEKGLSISIYNEKQKSVSSTLKENHNIFDNSLISDNKVINNDNNDNIETDDFEEDGFDPADD